jgi:type VI secretion system protein
MSAAPSLTLTIRGASAMRTIVVEGSSATIGRNADCTVVLADARRAISRLQARIDWRDGHYVLTDTGSNPTLVNGRILNVSREALLQDTDTLSIDEYLIEIGIDEPSASDDATVFAAVPGVSQYARADDVPTAMRRRGGHDATVKRPPKA